MGKSCERCQICDRRLLRVTSDLVELAAGPAMSASHPKRPSAMKMRSVAKGQERQFASQQSRPLFDHFHPALENFEDMIDWPLSQPMSDANAHDVIEPAIFIR